MTVTACRLEAGAPRTRHGERQAMRRAEVVVARDAEELAQRAAGRIVEAARGAEGVFTLALSGGVTPRRLYALLASQEFSQMVAWERTHVFFADERAAPPNHRASNFGMAWRLLLSRVPMADEHLHRMMGEAKDLEAAARNYEAELERVCEEAGANGAPVLDLVLLGIGEDGHTASLFPGTAALEERERWVVASYAPTVDGRRLTLTRPLLAAARELLFVASGERKAGVVRRVLAGDRELPAALVAAEARRVGFFLDQAAASAWQRKGKPRVP